MPASSLYHLARKACVKNIRSITDVGDIPYDLLRPILLKLENPEQLRQLEEASPQLCGDDEELWREFIKRDIPNWEKKPHEPKNPKNWYKVYRKLRQDSQKEVDEDALILKAAMDGIKNERAKHTSKVVDPRLVRLPKLPRMGGMRVEGGRAKGTGASGNPSMLTFASGSKTKTQTGKGVLEKARREARELSLFSKSRLATPTHQLGSKATQVRSAPQGLVEEHRRPVAPLYTDSSPTKPAIIAPRKRNTAEQLSSSPSTGVTFEERERRLKALTNPSGLKRSLPLETSQAQSPPIVPPPSKSANSLHPPSAYVVPKSRNLIPEPKGCRPAAKSKAAVDPFMPAKRRRIS